MSNLQFALGMIGVILAIFGAAWLNGHQIDKRLDEMDKRFEARFKGLEAQLDNIKEDIREIKADLKQLFKPILLK